MTDVPLVDRIEVRAERATWTKAGPLMTRLPDEEVLALEERAMATVGDPSPMGLWAFATGTWIAGTVIGGAVGGNVAAGAAAAAAHAGAAGAAAGGAFTAVVPVLLVFAGIVQFIAGLFAYRRASPLMATAFCCFGAFAVTASFMFLLAIAGSLPLPLTGNGQLLFGFVLESFGFIALALTIAAIGINWSQVLWLGTLCVGFALTGIPELTGATGGSIVGQIGGWFMVASAFFAYYLGAALVVNSASKRSVLPIFGRAC